MLLLRLGIVDVIVETCRGTSAGGKGMGLYTQNSRSFPEDVDLTEVVASQLRGCCKRRKLCDHALHSLAHVNHHGQRAA